jgi:hypothetical protein
MLVARHWMIDTVGTVGTLGTSIVILIHKKKNDTKMMCGTQLA